MYWLIPRIQRFHDRHPDVELQFNMNYGQIDVVRDKCLLPNLHRGEQVVIHPVGAYNVTQSMQFIEMKPAVVLVSPKGEVKLIKRRETMEDMVAMES